VRDNPDKQVIGAALKAVSLVRNWSHCGSAKRSTMLPETDATFSDDKVVAAETPYFLYTRVFW
jgi:hypothetical protein